MNKNITIREYREGDEISIMKLRGLVLSGSKDMDWWLWQRSQNPAGEALTTVAEDEDKKEIIGHHCYLPLRMKHEDQVYLFAMAIDVMTNPDYRGLGLYPRMIEAAYKYARQHHIQYSYNIMGELVTRMGKGTGSTPIFKKTPQWIKPLHLESVVEYYFKKNAVFSSFITLAGRAFFKLSDRLRNYQIHTEVREVKEIDERFDTLWQQACSLHKTMLVRDRAYLDWRYLKKPDADYIVYVSEKNDQLLGYIILRNVENGSLKTGWIMDILTNDKGGPASMDLITKAIQQFMATNTDMILCTMPPKAYLTPVLQKRGFLMMSKWSRKEAAIRIRELTKGNLKSSLINPNNWYLTNGDSDAL